MTVAYNSPTVKEKKMVDALESQLRMGASHSLPVTTRIRTYLMHHHQELHPLHPATIPNQEEQTQRLHQMGGKDDSHQKPIHSSVAQDYQQHGH